MDEFKQELGYYRRQCNELGRRILHLQAEKTIARRDAARNRMLAELIGNSYKLESSWTKLDDIEWPCLQVILKAMHVDCAALLEFIPQNGCFKPISALGFPCELSPQFAPPILPGENFHVNFDTPPNPLVDSMRHFAGVPLLLWAYLPSAGLALLVGNTTEDQHLHRPFNEKDYEIATTALIVFVDIEARIRSQKALLDSEEKYRLLVENANDAIFVAQDGRIKFANSKTAQMIGCGASELMERPFAELVSPDNLGFVFSRHFEHLQDNNLPNRYSFRITDAAGKIIWIDLNTVEIEWEGRPATLNFARDITHQIQLEAQLRSAQKMEAIGTLAGGIAHDFNNILSAIIGYTDLMALTLQDDNPARSSLNEVMNAAQRAKELVYRILTFSRTHEQEQKPARMDLIVKEALKLLRPSLPATIRIEQQIDCRSTILVDPTQIHQVVVNLCTNAYQSMQDEGGVLKVSLAEVKLNSADSIDHLDLDAGDYLKLTISDTGHGMDEKTLQRIYDPYFTTKQEGKGTGLGLAVVYGIVNAHKGAIQVNSAPGSGTTFEVFFPIVGYFANSEPQLNKQPSRGDESILFVDDEAALVKLATQLLEKSGYRVVGQNNPLEALELFKSDPNQFDLVITDMTMPYMTGNQLAKALQAIRPDLPIIMCTGYSEKISSEKAQMMGIQAFLRKPLSYHDLTHNVRKAIDQQNPHDRDKTG
ncbi:MAG: response regulator [Desulfobacteraceae bacterium]|jgi:PAS domain S-box-containing protein